LGFIVEKSADVSKGLAHTVNITVAASRARRSRAKFK
jgi:hypothetical protein